MRDPLLFQTDDGGEINFDENGVETTDGLETAAYLSVLGGNETGPSWWGDTIQPSHEYKYNSRFQRALVESVASPASLIKLEEAAKNDLSELPTSNVSVSASLVGPKKVKLDALIDETRLEYTENWDSMKSKV